MKQILCALIIVLTATVSYAKLPDDTSGKLVLLESPEAAGHVDKQKLLSCVSLLMRELGLQSKEIPRILVLHVSNKEGQVAGVKANSIRRNASLERGDVYYEFWIVDVGTSPLYAVSLESILEGHFEIKLTNEERDQVLARVIRVLNVTVSAKKD